MCEGFHCVRYFSDNFCVFEHAESRFSERCENLSILNVLLTLHGINMRYLEMAEHHSRHGDGVKDVAFLVEDLDAIFMVKFSYWCCGSMIIVVHYFSERLNVERL